jgi:hypothetical protein
MSKHRRPGDRRRPGLVLAAISVAAITLLGASSPALAAKGGGGGGGKPQAGGTSSLELVLLDAADGVANHGDRITFNLSTTATDRPYVSLRCYQDGAWVYAASVGYFDGYPWAKEFTLSSSSWPNGAGDCTARLYTTKDGRAACRGGLARTAGPPPQISYSSPSYPGRCSESTRSSSRNDSPDRKRRCWSW